MEHTRTPQSVKQTNRYIKPRDDMIDRVCPRRRPKKERAKKTWRSTLKENPEEMGDSRHGAHIIASDRERWRLLVARRSEMTKRTQEQLGPTSKHPVVK